MKQLIRSAFLSIFLFFVSLTISCNTGPTGSDNNGGEDDRTALNITSTPSGADIYIDEGDTGEQTPATIDVTVGSHSVTLELLDFHTWTESYYVNEEETVNVEASLTPTFYFFDDFESGKDNWDYNPCEISSKGYNGSCLKIYGSTFLNQSFELPETLTPHVSFYYRNPGESATFCIKFSGQGSSTSWSRYLDGGTWQYFEVPSSVFQDRPRPSSCNFDFWLYWEPFELYIDNFSINAE